MELQVQGGDAAETTGTRAPTDTAHWLKALGPGLLFAAAAVGVSHLVQSTRAGAVYGLALLPVILLANAVKYPAFRFGPLYAVATGTSLLEGYRRQGAWALWLYAALTVATMFTVLAAVTVVTAGLAIASLELKAGPVAVSAVLLLVCGGLLAVGHYRWLDRVTKLLVGILTVSTLLATVFALPRIDLGTFRLWPPAEQLDRGAIFFIAALAGWMPSAIDVAVWQSLWTLARRQDTGHAPTMAESMRDFHIGYVGTALLAVCFLLMGAGVMHGSGEQFSESAGAFAGQVLRLYTTTLGTWAGPIIGISAFAVMFSTTLTVLDGFPRALAVLLARLRSPEDTGGTEMTAPAQRRTYWVSVVVLSLGALLVISAFITSLKGLVDIATTLSFLTAPILSVLNHRAVLAAEVPAHLRPPRWLIGMSLVGILVQGGFALYYLVLRYLT